MSAAFHTDEKLVILTLPTFQFHLQQQFPVHSKAQNVSKWGAQRPFRVGPKKDHIAFKPQRTGMHEDKVAIERVIWVD